MMQQNFHLTIWLRKVLSMEKDCTESAGQQVKKVLFPEKHLRKLPGPVALLVVAAFSRTNLVAKSRFPLPQLQKTQNHWTPQNPGKQERNVKLEDKILHIHCSALIIFHWSKGIRFALLNLSQKCGFAAVICNAFQWLKFGNGLQQHCQTPTQLSIGNEKNVMCCTSR